LSIAKVAHAKACSYCGEKLNWGNYLRSGHGLPERAPTEALVRFSLCCSNPDCRKRVTPDSVRFIFGKCYSNPLILLASALVNGMTPSCIKIFMKAWGVSRQTVARWMQWWDNHFKTYAYWRASKGRFLPGFDDSKLALGLIESFDASDPQETLMLVLKFLAPWRPAGSS